MIQSESNRTKLLKKIPLFTKKKDKYILNLDYLIDLKNVVQTFSRKAPCYYVNKHTKKIEKLTNYGISMHDNNIGIIVDHVVYLTPDLYSEYDDAREAYLNKFPELGLLKVDLRNCGIEEEQAIEIAKFLQEKGWSKIHE